jgi:hypothetical protein
MLGSLNGGACCSDAGGLSETVPELEPGTLTEHELSEKVLDMRATIARRRNVCTIASGSIFVSSLSLWARLHHESRCIFTTRSLSAEKPKVV